MPFKLNQPVIAINLQCNLWPSASCQSTYRFFPCCIVYTQMHHGNCGYSCPKQGIYVLTNLRVFSLTFVPVNKLHLVRFLYVIFVECIKGIWVGIYVAELGGNLWFIVSTRTCNCCHCFVFSWPVSTSWCKRKKGSSTFYPCVDFARFRWS